MKKLIVILLVAVMVMSFAACGTVNDSDVAILWSGSGVVSVPNSLINAMERAMYIKNIAYAHYGANGSQETQTKQALDALNAGCAALVVELVDVSAAQAIVDAAKAKDVPVVFFNCDVDVASLSYSKCAVVTTDLASLPTVQGEQIAASLVEKKKDKFVKGADRNEDGKITVATFGDVAATVDAVNATLAERNLSALDIYAVDSIEALVGAYTEEKAPVELIITDSDVTAQQLLSALQAKGYNKDRLKTHLTPIFTVGDTVDYKALVLAGRPAGEHTDDNVQEYFKSMQYVLDLRTVDEEKLEALICTTSNIIGNGRIAGTVLEDYDGIAVQVATVLRNLLKGKALTDSGANLIPYTVVDAG